MPPYKYGPVREPRENVVERRRRGMVIGRWRVLECGRSRALFSGHSSPEVEINFGAGVISLLYKTDRVIAQSNDRELNGAKFWRFIAIRFLLIFGLVLYNEWQKLFR